MGFSIPPHPLTNYEIQKYYQNGPRVNGAFSRDNVPKKTKDETYVINVDECGNACTIGLIYFVTEVKFFICIVLRLAMFLKKLKNLLGINQ